MLTVLEGTKETASLAAITQASEADSRVHFLSLLRKAGVHSIRDRQAIANTIGRARRQGRLEVTTK